MCSGTCGVCVLRWTVQVQSKEIEGERECRAGTFLWAFWVQVFKSVLVDMWWSVPA